MRIAYDHQFLFSFLFFLFVSKFLRYREDGPLSDEEGLKNDVWPCFMCMETAERV